MANSWKCPHCGNWIGPMQVHQDCARKQDEKTREVRVRCVVCQNDFPRSAIVAGTNTCVSCWER